MTDLMLMSLIGLGVALTIIGLNKKMGIFNLATVPIWVVLIVEFIAVSTTLAITFIALIIVEFYIAFVGNNA